MYEIKNTSLKRGGKRLGAGRKSIYGVPTKAIRVPEHMIEEIKKAVTIPVMAKARIGHFVEAQILQSLGIDYIDESEVLTPADIKYHIDKSKFKVPIILLY